VFAAYCEFSLRIEGASVRPWSPPSVPKVHEGGPRSSRMWDGHWRSTSYYSARAANHDGSRSVERDGRAGPSKCRGGAGVRGEASPAASVPVPSPEVPSPVQGAASTAESVVSSVQEDGIPVSADAEMAVPTSPIPAVRLNRGEKRQADEDEVRDSLSKIPPNRFLSGTAGGP